MESRTFYNEVLTEHNVRPAHKRALAGECFSLEGVNPSCGDDITLSLRVEDGVIVDGAATDIEEIREMGLVVLYRRLSAITSCLDGAAAEINTTVSCCGVTVTPGDIIVADENGFVTLPADEAAKIWLCRKAVGDMDDQEVTPFLIDKIKKTKDNEAFLRSINTQG